jgi:hypothetical protein
LAVDKSVGCPLVDAQKAILIVDEPFEDDVGTAMAKVWTVMLDPFERLRRSIVR